LDVYTSPIFTSFGVSTLEEEIDEEELLTLLEELVLLLIAEEELLVTSLLLLLSTILVEVVISEVEVLPPVLEPVVLQALRDTANNVAVKNAKCFFILLFSFYLLK
jgi:hypothetical protein